MTSMSRVENCTHGSPYGPEVLANGARTGKSQICWPWDTSLSGSHSPLHEGQHSGEDAVAAYQVIKRGAHMQCDQDEKHRPQC